VSIDPDLSGECTDDVVAVFEDMVPAFAVGIDLCVRIFAG
jgi:hypothetical protein